MLKIYFDFSRKTIFLKDKVLFLYRALHSWWILSHSHITPCHIVKIIQRERHLIKNMKKHKTRKELNHTIFRLPPFLFSIWFKTCNYILNGVAVWLGVGIIWKSGVTDEAFLFLLENTIIEIKNKESYNYLLLIWI